MSLDFEKYDAIITIDNERYSVMFLNATNGMNELTETFETLQEAENYVASLQVNKVIKIAPTEQNPPFEEIPGDPSYSTPSDRPDLPDPNDQQSKIDFIEECRQRNLYVEDGTELTSHEPDPLSIEETQGDSSETDLPSPKEIPDYTARFDDADDVLDQNRPSGGFQDPKTTNSQKANIDLRGMKPSNRNAVLDNPAGLGGVLGSQLREANPKFKDMPGDKVWSGQNNQWLVFTRDRPGNLNTGFGAQGHTQCGAIDMVVGRMSPHPREIDKNGNPVKVGPILNSEIYRDEGVEVVDAARIYMSQKTNIDINFGLAEGYMGSKTTQSAIGIKADAVRVISRSGGIKLVTHSPRNMNSQGAKNNTEAPGVEIISGNDDRNLQPMVLGDNLRELLSSMCEMISQINGTVSSITSDLEKLNTAVSSHVHFEGTGAPTTTSPDLQIQCIASLVKLASVDKYSQFVHNWNNSSIQNTYLGTSNRKSKKSILSRNNRVN